MKRISFYGAAGTVTGSNFLLTDNIRTQLLIDLGMFQGSKSTELFNQEPLHFDPQALSGVVVTHAHLDHCGRLPLLAKSYYEGKIYMTEATRALIEIVLRDAVNVARYEPDIVQLYDETDVERTMQQVEIVEYGQTFQVGQFHIVLRDAGHILGSSIVEVHHTITKGKNRVIVFSGDLGNYPEHIVKSTEMIEKADVVVMETTYGNREHKKEFEHDVLLEEVEAIQKNGGTLLIPAFSLERSQEILHTLDHMKKEGKMKSKTRVFLDSPMAIRATQVYKRFKELYCSELYNHAQQDDPFHFNGLYLCNTGHESRKIRKIKEPKVIIAGSGMMSGGRILRHAQHYLPLKSTRLLFVGYQAENTLGREILEGAKKVYIDEQEIHINASVRKSSGMSSHADQPKLLSWLKDIEGVKKLYLVHGENVARNAFKEKVQETTSIKDIILPDRNTIHQI
ncbi:MBL fold metallo-hydrolase [Patescibacteria group bacterium]